MLRLTPFLLFDGNCAEAMRFYRNCFGGDLMLTLLGETPMKHGFPEAQHNKVTYSYLKSTLVEFSATDWLHPVQVPKVGNMAAMYLLSDDPEELREIFGRLSDCASKEFFVELQEMPFGLYGHFTDRYGVSWFFRGGSVSNS